MHNIIKLKNINHQDLAFIDATTTTSWRASWVTETMAKRAEWVIRNLSKNKEKLLLISASIFRQDAKKIIAQSLDRLRVLNKLWEDYRFILMHFQDSFLKSGRLFYSKIQLTWSQDQNLKIAFSDWLATVEEELWKLPDDANLIGTLNALKRDIALLIARSRETIDWTKENMNSASENKSF